MKAELSLPPELVEAIADKIIEKLQPILARDNNDEDELLDVEGASKVLGTSKEQIYQWVSNAKHGLKPFPYLKSGKRLRFSKNDLMKWMNDR
jgi:excisionase family DNA binding protein